MPMQSPGFLIKKDTTAIVLIRRLMEQERGRLCIVTWSDKKQ